jgi:hypothetical protein
MNPDTLRDRLVAEQERFVTAWMLACKAQTGLAPLRMPGRTFQLGCEIAVTLYATGGVEMGRKATLSAALAAGPRATLRALRRLQAMTRWAERVLAAREREWQNQQVGRAHEQLEIETAYGRP